MKKNFGLIAGLLIALVYSGCNKEEEPIDYDAKDEGIIQDYFEANNITDTVATSYGVYIKHIVEGTGESPTLNDKVKVKYELYNLPSDQRVNQPEEPVTFALSNLIAGWQIGIPYMKVGGEAYLYVPRKYAYGDGVLKFKITLIEIE
ncbi:FKBP-type peptidyl-prolyl cis-trans isomerase [Labilibacter marinus]|uniref:FKBP-type peptidyl-prolyl cis-trans isomerase n=1 Tax=Labilibacter marinus TaxID=1477105 RepID=UPI0009500D8A|nr:FKBP-type peptidyl-prolyl cis-trans isomerase [Labilibacter marinus]